jgi:hypothetical protein
MKSLEPGHGRLGEVPCLAAIEQDSLDNCFVKLSSYPWPNILPSENLANTGPDASCFPQLLPDSLRIVVILREETTEVLENLDAF